MAKKKTDEQLVEEEKVKIAEMYKELSTSLVLFGAYCAQDLTPNGIPQFHVDLCRLLESEDRVALAAPRGFAKSTWVSKILPLWLALFKLKKDICIISASEGLAVEHMRWIKQKLESDPIILALFGDLKSDKWSETHIIIKHQDGMLINIRAKGAGGQIRGFRPDCIILDDIETDESVLSEEQRKKLKKWLFTACINCLLPGGQLILIGTVIHPLSVLADLLETPNGWCKRRWRAYKEGIQEAGYELWAELRTHEWLQKRKAEIGSFAFASEYMNDPKLDSEAPIKYEYIKQWVDLPTQLNLVIAVDPAYSEDVKSDYKVAVLVGLDDKNNRYLIDYIRTHCPTGDFIDQFLNMFVRHKGQVTAVGVPNSGVEKEFFKSVLDKSAERGIGAPITEVKNSFTATGTGQAIRNKKSRITAALQPLFEQGKYYIHENHVEAKEELLTIGSSRWDDIVDAMTYAEQILTPVFFEDEQDKRYRDFEEIETFDGYGIDY